MIWDMIIAALIGGVIGFTITFVICRLLPQEEIRRMNTELLEKEERCIQNMRSEQRAIEAETHRLQQEYNNIFNHVNIMKEEAEKTAKAFYDKEMDLAQERLDRALEAISLKYQSDEEACRQEYLDAIKEFAAEFHENVVNQKATVAALQYQLQDLQSKVNTAVEAAKREEEKKSAKDFYRLVLPETDLQEVVYLRQVEPFLRDKEALNKVIWKVYYEKPYTDLIGRVVGSKVKTGIYKITNLENQMCYVGQAVNIADRWRQHIKRGIGAETPTRNKLYPAMLEIGPHNFTFEIIEECDRILLNEREDYWQEYFKAKEFGYSIK